MEKRLLLATSLSLLILIIYSQLVHKRYPVDNKEVIYKNLTVNQTAQSALSTEIKYSLPVPVKTERYVFETDKVRYIFSNPGAKLEEAYLKEYNHNLKFEDCFLIPDWRDYGFNVQKTDASILFSYTTGGKKFLKEFIFSNGMYGFELRASVQSENTTVNLAGQKLLIGYKLGAAKDAKEKSDERFLEANVALEDKIERHSLSSIKRDSVYPGNVKWLALRNRYYCLILYPHTKVQSAFLTRPKQDVANLGFVLAENEHKFHIYLGPQEIEKLSASNLGFEQIVNFGGFDAISKILLKGLKFFFRISHNWGVSIILLTLAVFFCLYPLTLKQMSSMKKMQALHPQIEELKRSCKDNPQKLNKEIMELYRKNKINPLGGCLPLLLQIPVFFALYQALIRMPELRGAKFLWIKDLSEADKLFTLPFSLPILGNEINLLPILMAIGMFVQQKMSLSAQATGSAEQQKMMLIMLPLLFGVMFYHLSSGLVLYWFIQSILMLSFQWKTTRQATI